MMDNEKLLQWFIDKGIDEEYSKYLVMVINIYERNYKSFETFVYKFRRPYDGIYHRERVEFNDKGNINKCKSHVSARLDSRNNTVRDKSN
jgi:hypothetical protein